MEDLERRRLFSNFFISTSGSDSAAGSSGAPWKTIQHSAVVVKAGDTVTVRAGNYAGLVLGWDGPVSGTASKPITFKADAGVTINGTNNKTRDGINIENCDNIILDGFTIKPVAVDAKWRSGIRFGGGGTGNVARNNRVAMRAQDTMGIYSSFNTSQLVEGNEVSGNQDAGIYCSNSAVNPTVRFNTVHDLSDVSAQGVGIHFNGDASQGGTGIIEGGLIEGNIVFNCGTGISMDGMQNAAVRDNLLYGLTKKGITLFQIDASGPSTGCVINGNFVILHASGPCLQLNTGKSEAFSNTLINHGGPSIEVNGGTQALVGNYYLGAITGITSRGQTGYVFGDLNFDSQVSAQDYTTLDATLGSSEGYVLATLDHAGTVTAKDYMTIDANMGRKAV